VDAQYLRVSKVGCKFFLSAWRNVKRSVIQLDSDGLLQCGCGDFSKVPAGSNPAALIQFAIKARCLTEHSCKAGNRESAIRELTARPG
jgi:hypothetical protein